MASRLKENAATPRSSAQKQMPSTWRRFWGICSASSEGTGQFSYDGSGLDTAFTRLPLHFRPTQDALLPPTLTLVSSPTSISFGLSVSQYPVCRLLYTWERG